MCEASSSSKNRSEALPAVRLSAPRRTPAASGPLTEAQALEVLRYWQALELFDAPTLRILPGDGVDLARWRVPGPRDDPLTAERCREEAENQLPLWRDAFWKSESLTFDARRWFRLRSGGSADEALPSALEGAEGGALLPWERSLPFATVYLGVIDKQRFYSHVMRVLTRAWPGFRTLHAAEADIGGDGALAGEVFMCALTLSPWGKVVPGAVSMPGFLGALDLAVKRAKRVDEFNSKLFNAPDAAARAEIKKAMRAWEHAGEFSVAASLRQTEAIAERLERFFADALRMNHPAQSADLLAKREEDLKQLTMTLSDRCPEGLPVDESVLSRLSAGFAKLIGFEGVVSTVVRMVRRYPSFVPRTEDLAHAGSFYLSDLLMAESVLKQGGFADERASASPLGERLAAAENKESERSLTVERAAQEEDGRAAALRGGSNRSSLPVVPGPVLPPLSAPLTRLLRHGLDETLPRIDFLKDPAAPAELLKPSRLSLGRWPSDPSHHLYPAQQAAASAVASMADADGIGPLVSVNGPPGTGKSWLLRDVAAGIVVRRAAALAEIDDPKNVFVPDRRIPLKDSSRSGVLGDLTPLVDKVTKGFFILVASNNNAAIRNITDELPKSFGLRGERPDYWRAAARAAAAAAQSDADSAAARMEGDLFQEVGEKNPLDAVWGLTAATLGRRRNCRRFAEAVLLPKKKGFDATITTALRAHAAKSAAAIRASLEASGALADMDAAAQEKRIRDEVLAEGRKNWQTAREAFWAAKARVEARRAEIVKLCGSGVRPSIFQTPFADRPSQHKTSLWVDEAFEEARSELFLAALALLKALVLAEPYVFAENLRLLGKWLSGEGAPESASDNFAFLSLLSFIVPVLSTTFASAGRLLNGIGCEIDWLFIDEASQATPMAAAGAMMRAKRTVVLGDPRQLMPVVTVPAVLADFLRRRCPTVRPGWSPLEASLQMLVDRTMLVGAEIEDVVLGRSVWTGLPLRTHRRCGSPIFEIANALSYGGQMVQMTPRPSEPEPLASQWIDVKAPVLPDEEVRAVRREAMKKLGVTLRDAKIVPEEMLALAQLLSGLVRERSLSGRRVFVLSPFRSVADAAAQVIRMLKRSRMVRMALSANTVHAFQGQEADLVILVLGSSPGREGARQRRWAANPANLFNVAVTRARRALIVIGDKEAWTAERAARIMAEHLAGGRQADEATL